MLSRDVPRLIVSQPAVTALRATDRLVYAAIAEHAFDEAVCYPSQALIARKLGICRETVNRSCGRLRAAGWLDWTYIKRPRRWWHNQYELLEAYCVSPLAAKRITKRAHRRSRKRDHTNKKYCTCSACKRPERTPVQQLTGALRPSEQFRETLRERRRRGIRERYVLYDPETRTIVPWCE